MGGSSNPVKIAKDKYDDRKKNMSLKKFTFDSSRGYTPGGQLNRYTKKQFGFSLGGITNPGAEEIANIGKKYVDAPKQAKKDAKKFSADQDAAHAAQLEKFKAREAQEGAEKAAGDELASKRRRQDSRKKKQGRKGTILTSKLGGTGGEDNEGLSTLLGA